MAALDQDLWGDPTPLIDAGSDPLVAIRAVVNASWLLWALSGRKLHTAGSISEWWECPPGGRGALRVRKRPVASIDSVTRRDPWNPSNDAVLSLVNDYIVIGNRIDFRRMALTNIGGWAVTPPPLLGGWISEPDLRSIQSVTTMEVHYTVGSNLPHGTDDVTLKLADAQLKTLAGQQSDLPERIQTITRQNISWSILTTDNFLDKNRTGIVFVDQWLNAVNPGAGGGRWASSSARQPPRVFDPAGPKLVTSLWDETEGAAISSVTSGGSRTFFGHGSPSVDITHTVGDVYLDVDTGTRFVLT